MKQLRLLLFGLSCALASLAQKPVSLKSILFPLHWENQPLAYSIKGDSLVIKSGEKTDMFRDPNVTYNTDNAPKLLFVPDSDFVLTAKIHHPFKTKWDGGALVLKADSLNWIKCCFEKDYQGFHRIVTVVTKDVSDDCNSQAIKGNAVFFKIAKAGNVITIYVSETGKNWYLIRHLQINNALEWKLGFLSQAPVGSSNTVTFTQIKYRKHTIKDPYIGE